MKEQLPIILNIYTFKENSVATRLGIKMFHTAIEYADSEYSFGHSKDKISGIYDIAPMSYDEGTFIESVILGYCDRRAFFKTFEKIKDQFMAPSYNVLFKNCNHFANEFSKMLCNKGIPKKYTLLLGIGEFFRKLF